jgi:hypothetical protein
MCVHCQKPFATIFVADGSEDGKGKVVTVAASGHMTFLKATESDSASTWSPADGLFWNLHERTRALIYCKDVKQYLHYGYCHMYD